MRRLFALIAPTIVLISHSLPLPAQTAPSAYSAYTGTDAKVAPSAPALGSANTTITDPTFGSRILRVTDQNTQSGQSFISIDSGFWRAWNADSTAIKLTGPHGDGYWLEFNPSTFKVGDGSSNPAVHPVPFGATWEWSAIDPNIIYFLNGNQIAKYNKSTGTTTNLGGPSNGDALGYMATVIGLDNWVCAAAGPGAQDSRYKIFCLNPVSPATRKFIDVYNKTIDGTTQTDANWPTSASGQIIGIHSMAGGTGANWLYVTFHQQNWGGNGDSVLDLATNTWTLITNADNYWTGHASMGNGKFANAAGSVDGRDSRGMLMRNPDNAMNSGDYKFIYQPAVTNNGWCDADHSSWLNSVRNAQAPILISRYGPANCSQYPWGNEIDAAAVDGSNTVWRFAHNHNAGFACYYGQAFAQISPDGKWALFSSYWDGTLGSDSTFGCSTRIDTFIVDLMSATGGSGTSSGGTGSGSGSGSGGSGSGSTSTSGTVHVEQNDASITYSGNWNVDSHAFNSGGSAMNAVDTGSRATFTFNGTDVTWIGYKDPWTGIANVYLDGVKSTVDTYSASSVPQAPLFTASGLASGTHTLIIEVSGTKNAAAASYWIWVDGFDYTSGSSTTTPPPPPPPPPPTGTPYRVDQTSAAVTWSGKWNPSKGSYLSGGSAKISQTNGARSTFSFTGNAVSWISYSDTSTGIARVYIDGTLKATVDTYSASAKSQTVAFSATDLAWGTHTIIIESTGTKNAASRSAYVWVDAFDYVGASLSASTIESMTITNSAAAIAGGMSVTTDGASAFTVASADVSAMTAAGGIALIAYRQDGITVSEAGLSGSPPLTRGRFDTEIEGAVNTGFALANPNESEARVSFFFTDLNGTDSGSGSITIPPHGQLARFLNQEPFNSPNANGTFSFTSDVPVSATALRGVINERFEFLLTALPIADPDQWNPSTVFFPHVADGGGWATQLIVVNPTDSEISGAITYFTQAGTAGDSQRYSIPPRSSRRFTNSETDDVTRTGSAQITPDASNAAPVGVAVFSYRRDGVIVSEAGVLANETANSFKVFADMSADGSVRSGLSVTNSSDVMTNVNIDLYNLDGSFTGLSSSIALAASSQRSFFLNELPELASMPRAFQGFVRISTNNGADIAVTGLRAHQNERGDILVTTLAPIDEATPATQALMFPHIVNGGGYSTRFLLYGNGRMNFHAPAGAALDLSLQ